MKRGLTAKMWKQRDKCYFPLQFHLKTHFGLKNNQTYTFVMSTVPLHNVFVWTLLTINTLGSISQQITAQVLVYNKVLVCHTGSRTQALRICSEICQKVLSAALKSYGSSRL